MADQIRAALERLLVDIDDLASKSVGVAGLLQFQDLARWSELLEGGEYQEWLGDAITQARAALAEACHANPAGQLLTDDELRRAWNAQADQFNRWDHLGLDEQLEWAQRQALQRLAPGNPTAPGEPMETYYDWIVSNAQGEQQASGSTPSYPLAVNEGNRYLSQYSQDGPHLLEILRVEVLYTLEAGQEGE